MSDHADGIIHRELETDTGDDPGVQIANVISDITDSSPDELPPMYNCTDGMLDSLFSEPPDQDANMDVTFDYHGYRITIEQDGDATFVPLD